MSDFPKDTDATQFLFDRRKTLVDEFALAMSRLSHDTREKPDVDVHERGLAIADDTYLVTISIRLERDEA